jgi:hypothetical protein
MANADELWKQEVTMTIAFNDFIQAVPEENKAFTAALHEQLLEQGCTASFNEAKSGFTVSYQWNKKTVMNWVFRKTGMWARIYGDNAKRYETIIAVLPVDMQKKMTTSRDCKRLLNPTACSDTCVMGFVYSLNGNTYKKCRNDGMLFLLSDETAPYIQNLVCAEVAARKKD